MWHGWNLELKSGLEWFQSRPTTYRLKGKRSVNQWNIWPIESEGWSLGSLTHKVTDGIKGKCFRSWIGPNLMLEPKVRYGSSNSKAW